MKWYKKYTSIHHYIAVLKRQPVHMQHVYAFLFASGVTALLAAFILYVDYGYWRERYVRGEDAVVSAPLQSDETGAEKVSAQGGSSKYSPLEMLRSFGGEVKYQFSKVGTGEANYFNNKEVYIRESQ